MSKTIEISVLNVGRGDMELRFDPENEKERKDALDLIERMLRQGHAVLIPYGDSNIRVVGVDRDKAEYIVREKKGEDTRVPMETAPATTIGRSAGG